MVLVVVDICGSYVNPLLCDYSGNIPKQADMIKSLYMNGHGIELVLLAPFHFD
jgi:hypothetical protein